MKFEPGTSLAETHGESDHGHGHDHFHGQPEGDGELNLKVDGMTCAGCAIAVRNAIESLPGVEEANINVTEGRASVHGRDLDRNRIVQAVRESGYDAQVIEELAAPAELRSEIELRQSQHERQWKRRAIIGLSVWAPLEILHWVGRGLGWHAVEHALGVSWMDWLMFIGATVVLIAAGGGFYRSAWNAAKRRATNMDTLIAMGATTAYVYSLVVFLMKLLGSDIDQPLYFTESAALLGIISLGHYLEARATARAGSAVRELLELQPEEAEIIEHQHQQSPGIAIPGRSAPSTRRIPSAEVKPGDVILIRPGARVPVDGVVAEGESHVDEAVVTGESVPVRKSAGDPVIAGSMNTTGRLVIEAKVDGRHTTVARIAAMVQRAQSSKADIQRLADYVASIFVPAVLLIALLTLVGWMIAGQFTTGVIATVTVLIISCPCALGLATPMAVMVGAGAASQRGILIKSAMALETAGRATHVVFDKTGTLTAGAPALTGIEVVGEPARPRDGFERSSGPAPPRDEDVAARDRENDLLRLAAAVEAPSEHPVAKAIVRAARERNVSIPPVQDFQAIPGEGVRGVVEGRSVRVTRDERFTARIEVDGQIAGRLMVTDQLRPDAKAAIDQLRAMNLRVFMLSGDRREVAEQIGAELGLRPDEIIAEATPESKVEFVRRLSSDSLPLAPGAGRGEGASRSVAANGRTLTPDSRPKGKGGSVIMVGDGINDAAALAKADLGIAMASGTNIAIESADVVIPSDRVSAAPETVRIAQQTLKTIKQNLFFAFFYNAAAIPAAALGLLGPFGPLIAAAAMGFSDITVIGNAIRLKRKLGSWRVSHPRAARRASALE